MEDRIVIFKREGTQRAMGMFSSKSAEDFLLGNAFRKLSEDSFSRSTLGPNNIIFANVLYLERRFPMKTLDDKFIVVFKKDGFQRAIGVFSKNSAEGFLLENSFEKLFEDSFKRSLPGTDSVVFAWVLFLEKCPLFKKSEIETSIQSPV